MNSRLSIGVVSVVVLVIAAGSLWYYEYNTQKEQTISPPIKKEEGYVPRIINAKHQFKNNIHTVAGEVELPTPCYLLETESFVKVREPAKDIATIRFTTVNNSDICAEVITPGRFKETFGAGEDAEINATWNNKPVLLNLIEVSPEEDLDKFELFIKG